MMQTIKTKNGDYHFEPVHLYHGRKKIDRLLARQNLLDIAPYLFKSSIRWGLIYGTLLGAIREKNFIEHDEDTDIFVLNEDRQKFINILHELKTENFKVARFSDSLISVIRNNEYIDFYFFRCGLMGRRSGGYYIPNKFFRYFSHIELFEHNFPTLAKPIQFLEYAYGINWKTPVSGSHAQARPPFWKIMLKKIPFFVQLHKRFKKYE